jgi:hypothetical protein
MDIKEIKKAIADAERNILECAVKELSHLQNLLKDESISFTDLRLETVVEHRCLGGDYLLVYGVKIEKEF